MPKLHLALGILGLIYLAVPAAADVQTKTTYNYFTVTGKTARQIYISILSHGISQGGLDSLASTKVNLSQRPTLSALPICKMQKFRATMTFKINLPRLGNVSALAPTTRRSWTEFAATLKAHEEHHRMIWTSCAEELSRLALQIKSGNCTDFKDAYTRISKDSLTNCKAKNKAFDATEGIRFLTLPFIRQVGSGK